jgi:uncharacterized membrane protein (TIGR02234 family)
VNRRLFSLALLLDVLGAGGALLISTRPWQSIVLDRARPLADVGVQISGRSLDPAILGATLVALAGVVAVLATRGLARRAVGLFIALAALLLAWRAIAASKNVSHSRAISLVTDRRGGVGVGPNSVVHITAHPIWPILTVVAAMLALIAGALVMIFGGRWSSMSARYEAPSSNTPQTDEGMWTALDRGDDPTVRTESQG